MLDAGIACAAASVVLVSIAQLAMRWGMTRLPASEPLATLAAHGGAVAAVLAGLACYGVSMLTWAVALRRLPLSVAYPLLSLSYVLVYLAAGLIPAFAERLSATRTLGVLLIVCGVTVLMSRATVASAAGVQPR
jgi:undecaprenyl phosphate-alpha-L-ara4N flippase subunit ArnF